MKEKFESDLMSVGFTKEEIDNYTDEIVLPEA